MPPGVWFGGFFFFTGTSSFQGIIYHVWQESHMLPSGENFCIFVVHARKLCQATPHQESIPNIHLSMDDILPQL